MAQKPTLSVKEKILLHLFENVRFEGGFEVPHSVTQDGMAQVVAVRRSYVSQIVKELFEKGLLEDELHHVRGETRRRKAYFLTPEGKIEAENLYNKIQKLEVILREGQGERALTFADLREQFKSSMSILEVIQRISDDGIFDATTRHIPKQLQKIDVPLNLPKPRYFFGREYELELIEDFLKSESFRILAIKGIAGIGKTTLMAQVAEKHRAQTNIFWYKFHSWSTQRNLLVHLSEFLAGFRKEGLKQYMEEVRVIDIGDVLALLKNQLEGMRMLFVFDDFHMANKAMLEVFTAFSELAKTISGLKMVFLGRSIPKFYDQRDVLVDKLIFELPLLGLDKRSSGELLNLRNIGEEHLEEIFESTKGHPLSLELVEISKGKMAGGNIRQFLWEEVLVRLKAEEKDLLRFASVFRFPIQSEGYLCIPRREEEGEITHEVIDALVEKSLIERQDSLYNVHDIIKAFFYQRLSPDVKRDYHRRVAEYFEDESDDLAIIEAQYHHIKADNQNRAVGLAVQHGEHLINRGYLEEFREILASIVKENVAFPELISLLIMEGDILTTLGEWDRAYALYERCLNVSLELEDAKGTARAYYKIASISYRRGEFDNALSLNNKSFKILKDENEPKELAKLYNNIGVIHWKKGASVKAKESYLKSLDIAQALGDIRGIARAKNNLGIIHWEEGELEKAIEFYESSLIIAEELGDRQTQAILYDNLGEVYAKRGNFDSAKRYFELSLDLSKKLGFRWQIAEVLRNLGDINEGDLKKEHLSQAYEMFVNLGAKKDADELKKRLDDF